MKPDMMRNKILQGDVLEKGRHLPSNSVNCIVSSPPYFNQRDYGLPPTDWAEISYAPLHGLSNITIPAQSCCLGREKTIEAYIGHLVLIFRLLRSALRDDAVMWLNIGDSYANDARRGGCSGNKNYTSINGGYHEIRNQPTKTGLPPKNLCGIPWRLSLALQADRWILRSDVIWEKSNGTPSSVTDRPTMAHEYLFLLSKSSAYWYDNEAIKTPIKQSSKNRLGRGVSANHKHNNGAPGQHVHGFHKVKWEPQSDKANRRSVWRMATAQYCDSHFAVMPSEMAELCILSACPPQTCAECGSPYKRVIVGTGTDSTGWKPTSRATNQFEPICTCKAGQCPGIVLDPFIGSGTTAQVAIQNKRDWLGIELNPDYIKLAMERIARTQPPLFAAEEAQSVPTNNEIYELAMERDALVASIGDIDSRIKELI